MIIRLTKKMLRKIIGETFTGMLDYYRGFPNTKDDLPFNGQDFRKKFFLELVERFSFNAVFETGSYLGSTTNYIYEKTYMPVYTVEFNPRLRGYVRARFLLKPAVKTFSGDSRNFLNKISINKKLSNKKALFYLDAHWNDDLPLAEEISIITSAWPDCIIMIDDFKVPDDPDYKYDNYGDGKTLSMSYLQPLLRDETDLFFPERRGELESGRKRGCVVFSVNKDSQQELEKMKTLRKYQQ